MDIGDLLERQAILPRVNATSKRHALGVMAETAARLYGVKAADVTEALSKREQKGSTGVGFGVALPHGRIKGLARPRGVFARLETPIAFGAVDDQPVDLIFALLTPLDGEADHLRALARVSRALRRAKVREQLRQARTQDALHALLAQEAQTTAA
jgi:PTS system nitrogen regulatory IIA component